ncbi:shikimate kinase [Paenibacillus cellulosilyticus]|uniref:Shikimate kinase n=1 Tax=Paenibacillus cellulosilyticus TaxID=375489 RepID=A0A2V2YPT2_9BACL|nr:AAA family ATPase [Paenibacillus cellulosilyticus]PWV94451.1 shikimate kinase [Paenibacillus cellulosilyticus]QKS44971.1 AAA family ATPase [Paenibacillus cellulosilyticus]
MERLKYLHETNKNIIITGIPRAGKSTVAFEISKRLNYNLVQLDSIVEAMKRAFPDFEVIKKPDGIMEVSKSTPFIIEYLKELNDDPPRKKGINYVIEGSDIDLNEFYKHFAKDDFIVVGICYLDRSAEEIYHTMKKYDTIIDWSYYMEDDELLKYSEALVSRNKRYAESFQKHDIKYYDVSHDRNKVLKEIENDIVREVQSNSWEPL